MAESFITKTVSFEFFQFAKQKKLLTSGSIVAPENSNIRWSLMVFPKSTINSRSVVSVYLKCQFPENMTDDWIEARFGFSVIGEKNQALLTKRFKNRFTAKQAMLGDREFVDADKIGQMLVGESLKIKLEVTFLDASFPLQDVALQRLKLAEDKVKLAEERAKLAEERAQLAEERARFVEEQAASSNSGPSSGLPPPAYEFDDKQHD